MKTIAALMACLALTACAPSAKDKQPDPLDGVLSERIIVLEDGRTVACVVFKVDRGGGVSCDWGGAR